jgi:hypothetical protein
MPVAYVRKPHIGPRKICQEHFAKASSVFWSILVEDIYRYDIVLQDSLTTRIDAPEWASYFVRRNLYFKAIDKCKY